MTECIDSGETFGAQEGWGQVKGQIVLSTRAGGVTCLVGSDMSSQGKLLYSAKYQVNGHLVLLCPWLINFILT